MPNIGCRDISLITRHDDLLVAVGFVLIELRFDNFNGRAINICYSFRHKHRADISCHNIGTALINFVRILPILVTNNACRLINIDVIELLTIDLDGFEFSAGTNNCMVNPLTDFRILTCEVRIIYRTDRNDCLCLTSFILFFTNLIYCHICIFCVERIGVFRACQERNHVPARELSHNVKCFRFCCCQIHQHTLVHLIFQSVLHAKTRISLLCSLYTLCN